MRNIYFWHGENEKLRTTLMAIEGVSVGNDDSLIYIGSLDNFAEKYGDKFMVLGDSIAVSQYNSFGMR